MFGHHDDTNDQAAQGDQAKPAETFNDAAGADNPNRGESPDTAGIPTVADPDPIAPQPVDDTTFTPSDDWQHPGSPIGEPSNPPALDIPGLGDQPADDVPAGPAPISDIIGGSNSSPTALPPAPGQDDNTPQPIVGHSDSPASPAAPSGDLADVKQKALGELEPLVDQLDQSPEEKFRTIMMMIQASDNQGLIDKAYQAAQAIEDEKARAQALLDVVNEVNYFAQQHPQG